MRCWHHRAISTRSGHAGRGYTGPEACQAEWAPSAPYLQHNNRLYVIFFQAGQQHVETVLARRQEETKEKTFKIDSSEMMRISCGSTICQCFRPQKSQRQKLLFAPNSFFVSNMACRRLFSLASKKMTMGDFPHPLCVLVITYIGFYELLRLTCSYASHLSSSSAPFLFVSLDPGKKNEKCIRRSHHERTVESFSQTEPAQRL